jgi:hypothetical protein
MVDCQTWLQTIAAVSAAMTAIAAAYVAKNSFAFQRNSLLKKAIIENILELLHQIQYLKSLTTQPALMAADEDVMSLKDRISEARKSVVTLRSMISASTSKEIKIVRDVMNELEEDIIFAPDGKTPSQKTAQRLDDAISALQRIYRTEIK